MNSLTPTLARELTAALHWWQLAGVDCDFADDATAWLDDGQADQPVDPAVGPGAAAAKVPDETRHAEIARIDLLGTTPPTDLGAFRRFWLETPGLDTIGPRGRIPPRGPADADLMVLVIDPEEHDSDRLLDGPQGRLLSNMLAAMGIAEDRTYFASALPRPTPMPDTAKQSAQGMMEVTLHHIALAAPKRVLAFGTNILPLLGVDAAKDALSLPEINQNRQNIPLMVSEGLDSLMSMPRLKARFWRRWIEWAQNR